MTYDLLWDQDQGIQLGARTMLVQGPGPTLTGTTSNHTGGDVKLDLDSQVRY